MLSSNGSDGNHSKPLRLRRVNHSDEVVIGFSKLLKTESMTDVTSICSGGQTIRAHRVILSTFSEPSLNLNLSPIILAYPVIVIKDLALSELRTIAEFIYKGEVSVSRDKFSTVLQAAKELEVSGLSDLKVDGHKCSVQMQLSEDSCNLNSSGRRKLRLQQLQQQHKYHHHHNHLQQSQGQKYQQQIQLQLLQERQEAKLIELHQQLRQVSGLGSSNDTIIPDQDDSTTGLNCSGDGYGDDSFPLITDLRTINSSSGSSNTLLTNGNGHLDKSGSGSNNKNNNGDGSSIGNGTGNGKPAPPDFLQPRGSGRPRKGNKSNDISPCPECNKVSVQPDVFKQKKTQIKIVNNKF